MKGGFLSKFVCDYVFKSNMHRSTASTMSVSPSELSTRVALVPLESLHFSSRPQMSPKLVS